MERARLFVGLVPEETTAREIVEAAERVLGSAQWRLYGPRDVHLTLCFLGEVEREHVERLSGELGESCRGLAAPELEIAGLGAFPDAEHPRAVWAGVRGSDGDVEALKSLVGAVVRTVAGLGLPHDVRERFAPHLTLARPRGRARLEVGPDALGRVWPWRPKDVILFESVGGSGERYLRRSVARLGIE